MSHPESHPLAGRTVRLNETAKDPQRQTVVAGAKFTVRDWWDRGAEPWYKLESSNFACYWYGKRWVAMVDEIFTRPHPLQELQPVIESLDEVVYGYIGPYGHLVHVSELGEEVEAS